MDENNNEVLDNIISLKDEEGNEIGKFYFYVDQILEVNEEKVLQSGISSDVTEAVTVEYAIVIE